MILGLMRQHPSSSLDILISIDAFSPPEQSLHLIKHFFYCSEVARVDFEMKWTVMLLCFYSATLLRFRGRACSSTQMDCGGQGSAVDATVLCASSLVS